LRAIQEKCVRPVGAAREVPVDVRIISASHRDLAQEVEKGRFRQDLFYRINVIELRLPALRERPEDIRRWRPISCANSPQRPER
jgi:two-component system, NtrC family, response regulator PilR